MLRNFQVFLTFDGNIFFIKINKGIGSVSNSLDTDQARHVSFLSGLILVSTVCDAHQQMKLAGKELKAIGL